MRSNRDEKVVGRHENPLLITGCGTSNSAENPAGFDSQIAENAEQTVCIFRKTDFNRQ